MEYVLHQPHVLGAAIYPSLAEILSTPLSYINVCKFKIVCDKLSKVGQFRLSAIKPYSNKLEFL